MVGIPEHIVVGIDPRSLKSKTGSKSAIFLQNYPANNKLLSDLQRESEHSEIGRRLLESSYNFKKSNVQYKQTIFIKIVCFATLSKAHKVLL